MCGIAGFVGRADPGALERMSRSMVLRGPDAAGAWSSPDGAVHFTHRRLSIIDLADGAQPMRSADGNLTIVFNGEIYNHMELRADLESRGGRFLTDHSDTEVLLQGYALDGPEFVHRLNGMWAFAIHDRKNRRIFCSRDRFGKKPFFYFSRGAEFAFASELNALLEHPSCPRSIDPLSLKKFFAYCLVPAPRTILRGVHKLPAGCNMFVDLADGSQTVRRYWEYLPEPEPHGGEKWEVEKAEELRELLRQAVRRRLVSDVPLGVFLSGGIDSAAVAAFAARETGGGRLQTFSIGFTQPSFDESAHAKNAARFLGCRHHLEVLDLHKAREFLPRVLSRLDEPQGDPSLLPTWLLSRFARRSVTVALGGDGGDELFAGYDPFRALHVAEWYRRLVPRPVHEGIRLLAGLLPVSHENLSLDFKIKRTLRGLGHRRRFWMPVWMGALSPRAVNDLFGDRTPPEELYSEAVEAWESAPGANLVDRTTQFFVRLYLQDGILAKADRASMMNSLEVRSPFLDINVADFARRLPSSVKLRNGVTKYLLKKALEPVLPAEILHRRKKGFGVPVGEWFREGALKVRGAGPFREETARKLIRAHTTGSADERQFLWCQFALENWIGNRPAIVAP